MAALEKRFPRDVFTKKLRRICERLDECATRTISFKHFLRGILEWEFVEITEASLAPIAKSDIRGEAYLFRCWTMWGKATQRLVPAALRLMREREPHGAWRELDRTRNSIKCGGTALYLGRPRLPVHRLDGDLSVRQIALAPHISAKGPNGFWLIRRGPKHPDLAALKGRFAFHLRDEETPCVMNSSNDNDRDATVLELFTTKASATMEANQWNEDSELPPLIVAKASNAELLELTGLCDWWTSTDRSSQSLGAVSCTWSGPG